MHRLMIVDDDLNIRRGLSQAIPWEDYGICIFGVAGDGQTALNMMEHALPDIVVADIRMPKIDGLEFTKQVGLKYPEVKVILLTAYKDFEYAKTALKLNAYDYLLKPVDNQTLLDVVFRAAQTKAEQQKINQKLEESTPLLLQQFLIGLIEERYTINEIYDKMELLGIKAIVPPLVVMVIKAADYYQVDDRLKKDVLKNAILEIITEILQAGQGMAIDSGQDEVVLFYSGKIHSVQQIISEARQLAEMIVQKVQQSLQTTVTIGIGRTCENITEAGRSYTEACSALDTRHILGKNQIYFGRDLPEVSENVTVDIYPVARELLQQIRLGLLEESLGLLESVEQKIRSEWGLTLEHLQLVGMEITILLFSEVKEWPEIGIEIGKKYDFYQFNMEIKQCQTVIEMMDKLREIICEICTVVNRFRKNVQQTVIDQAISYIKDNFAKPDLSLQDVADQIHLSPTYLSNIFKKERGINFSDFILELRMNKAKELLRDGDLKIYEVADSVGYNNVHYFSACFKKYTGTSPTDFKNI